MDSQGPAAVPFVEAGSSGTVRPQEEKEEKGGVGEVCATRACTVAHHRTHLRDSIVTTQLAAAEVRPADAAGLRRLESRLRNAKKYVRA